MPYTGVEILNRMLTQGGATVHVIGTALSLTGGTEKSCFRRLFGSHDPDYKARFPMTQLTSCYH